jgi:hypothetical protein
MGVDRDALMLAISSDEIYGVVHGKSDRGREE